MIANLRSSGDRQLRAGEAANEAAVLFLIFNRPGNTAEVMDAIRAARPSRLYVAGDGPRAGRGEDRLCADARAIATSVDWPCIVKTLFRERNLGCRVAVSTAISWFFENEEEGIILEDDCVPSQSFFPYCAALLQRYRNDERVMSVSGSNFDPARPTTPHSYYFSRYNHIWGWATWRRAWDLYDPGMTLWKDLHDSGLLESWSDREPVFIKSWTEIFDEVARHQIDTWDYQWTFACWAHHGLTCLPAGNLVTNIGFGADATHTTHTAGPGSGLAHEDIAFPLRHPPMMVRDVEADRRSQIYRWPPRERPSVFQTVRLRFKLRTRIRKAITGFAH